MWGGPSDSGTWMPQHGSSLINIYNIFDNYNFFYVFWLIKINDLCLSVCLFLAHQVLKFYAWEPYFQEKVTTLRNLELKALRKASVFFAMSYILWFSSPFLVPYNNHCFSHLNKSMINPLRPHDALKHHFTSLKTDLFFLQPGVLDRKFPWNSFTNTWHFSKKIHPHQIIFNHYKSRIPAASRGL